MLVMTEGQTDAKIKLRVDYEDGTQVTESFLSNANALEILYRWEKEDTSSTDTTGTWTATYEMDGTTPYLVYQFNGSDAVPSDGEGFLYCRAKVTGADGRINYGRKAFIKVNRDELI